MQNNITRSSAGWGVSNDSHEEDSEDIEDNIEEVHSDNNEDGPETEIDILSETAKL